MRGNIKRKFQITIRKNKIPKQPNHAPLQPLELARRASLWLEILQAQQTMVAEALATQNCGV